MRARCFSLILVWALLALSLASPARAAEDHECGGDMTTIVSLRHCVHHAVEMGHVLNAGVAKSLLAKLDSAQAAVDRQQQGVAINVLEAFIHQVNAQADVHIYGQHADHLAMHAEMVIDALSSP